MKSISSLALLFATAPPFLFADDGQRSVSPFTDMELPATTVIDTSPLPSSRLPLEKASSNVQTARGDDIYRHEALDLSDFMKRNLPSVSGNEVLANPFQLDLNYRGFTASPILGTPIGLSVYQDSVRVNEPFGDMVNWDLIPRVAIANVELIPGSNPLFGLNTLGGALLVRTKSGRSHAGWRGQAYAGSFERKAIEAEHGGSRGGFDWFFAGNLFEEDGFRDFSHSSVKQGFVKLGWEDERSDIDLSYTYAENKLTGNGVAPASLLALERNGVYAHPEVTLPRLHFVNLALSHLVTDDWVLSGNAYFRRNVLGVYAGDVEVEQEETDEFEAEPTVNQTLTRQDGVGGSLQVSYLGTLLDRVNQAILGASYDFGDTDFKQTRQDAELTASRGVEPEGAASRQTTLTATNRYYGIYLTDTFSPTPWLHITGAGRWNRAEIHLDGSGRDPEGDTESLDGRHAFSRVNPAAGFTLQPLKALAPNQSLPDLSFFASYNEGFRVPTPVELTCADPAAPCSLPTNFVADPPLKPIVARTFETGFRGKLGKALDWNLAWYRTDLSDDILFINSPGTLTRGFFKNVGDTRREGIEAGMRGGVRRLSWYASYGYVDATYRSAVILQNAIGPVRVRKGDRIPAIPDQTAKVGADYELLPGWFLGADLQYFSRRFLRGDDSNRFPRVDEYVVVNLNTRYALTRHVELFALANNVFDARYETFGLINRNAFSSPVGNAEAFLAPGAPLSGWAGVRVRFD